MAADLGTDSGLQALLSRPTQQRSNNTVNNPISSSISNRFSRDNDYSATASTGLRKNQPMLGWLIVGFFGAVVAVTVSSLALVQQKTIIDNPNVDDSKKETSRKVQIAIIISLVISILLLLTSGYKTATALTQK